MHLCRRTPLLLVLLLLLLLLLLAGAVANRPAAPAQAPLAIPGDHPDLADTALPSPFAIPAYGAASDPSRPSSLPADAMASAARRTAPLVFPAPGRHTATVIFAHGLGDTGHGWASAVENWRRRQRLDEVKFVLPHAPEIPITVNGGMRMPGWFDLKALGGNVDSLRRSEDKDGILKSQEYFHSLVQAEVDAGIPADRVVLGGFSQGGAMSLFSGLTFKSKLAGIVGLSCWLPLSGSLASYVPEDTPHKETKIFLGHGDEDPLVPLALAKFSLEFLKNLGYDASLTEYRGMGHSACLSELDQVEAFLRDRLPPLEKK